MKTIKDMISESSVKITDAQINKMRKSPLRKKKLNEHYHKLYPTDTMWEDIDDCTLEDAFDRFLSGEDIYDVIGTSDSIIRERVFTMFSVITGIDYNVLYDHWMENCR